MLLISENKEKSLSKKIHLVIILVLFSTWIMPVSHSANIGKASSTSSKLNTTKFLIASVASKGQFNFTIPVDIKNLMPKLQYIGIYCQVEIPQYGNINHHTHQMTTDLVKVNSSGNIKRKFQLYGRVPEGHIGDVAKAKRWMCKVIWAETPTGFITLGIPNVKPGFTNGFYGPLVVGTSGNF